MQAGGHVIRFLDHPLLPADSPPDFPKIVKGGINDDGPMHPDSPHVSGPDGVATLLYQMGREDWLKRFLDTTSTEHFEIFVKCAPYMNLYVTRTGRDVEMGFFDSNCCPAPGTRYRVDPSGSWVPVSTSDLGGPWGGSQVWVRAQGEGFCKGIWFGSIWKPDSVSVTWSDMTDAEVAANCAAVAALVAKGKHWH